MSNLCIQFRENCANEDADKYVGVAPEYGAGMDTHGWVDLFVCVGGEQAMPFVHH